MLRSSMRLVSVLILLSLAACALERDADVTVDEGDTVAIAPDVQEPASRTTAPGGGDRGVYVARGVCPFECCTYRDWVLETPATVRPTPDENAPAAFALEAGTSIRADSGNVYVTSPGIVIADRPFPVAETPGAPTVAAGDTLYLLDSMGEGFFHTRYKGRVYESSGAAWFGGGPPGSTTSGRLVRGAESDWWVHVTLSDGRTGWIMMDDIRVDGADACG